MQRIKAVTKANVYWDPNPFKALGNDANPSIIHELLVKDLAWTQGKVNVFGWKNERRLTCLYADAPGTYHYSHKAMEALPWHPLVVAIRDYVEEKLNRELYPKGMPHLDTCLCNYHADGNDVIGWHADDETDLDQDAPIVSVSFGVERRFILRSMTKHTGGVAKDEKITDEDDVETKLGNGAILVMGAGTQEHYVHSVPKETKITTSRVNLTFRKTIK
jgi:alkylated DNA repair dioxygenase AlkB